MHRMFGSKVLELYGSKFWNFGQLTLAHLDLSIRFKGDHAPSFYACVCILNFQFFEIHWYDTRHEVGR